MKGMMQKVLKNQAGVGSLVGVVIIGAVALTMGGAALVNLTANDTAVVLLKEKMQAQEILKYQIKTTEELILKGDLHAGGKNRNKYRVVGDDPLTGLEYDTIPEARQTDCPTDPTKFKCITVVKAIENDDASGPGLFQVINVVTSKASGHLMSSNSTHALLDSVNPSPNDGLFKFVNGKNASISEAAITGDPIQYSVTTTNYVEVPCENTTGRTAASARGGALALVQDQEGQCYNTVTNTTNYTDPNNLGQFYLINVLNQNTYPAIPFNTTVTSPLSMGQCRVARVGPAISGINVGGGILEQINNLPDADGTVPVNTGALGGSCETETPPPDTYTFGGAKFAGMTATVYGTSSGDVPIATQTTAYDQRYKGGAISRQLTAVTKQVKHFLGNPSKYKTLAATNAPFDVFYLNNLNPSTSINCDPSVTGKKPCIVYVNTRKDAHYILTGNLTGEVLLIVDQYSSSIAGYLEVQGKVRATGVIIANGDSWLKAKNNDFIYGGSPTVFYAHAISATEFPSLALDKGKFYGAPGAKDLTYWTNAIHQYIQPVETNYTKGNVPYNVAKKSIHYHGTYHAAAKKTRIGPWPVQVLKAYEMYY